MIRGSASFQAARDDGMDLDGLGAWGVEIQGVESEADEQTGAKAQFRFKLFTGGKENRNRDIVELKGMKTANFMKNPVIFYQHDWDSEDAVIGNMTSIEINGRGEMIGTLEFHGLEEKSRKVEAKVAARILRAGSIGHFPITEEKIDEDEDDAWLLGKEYKRDWLYIGRYRITESDLAEFSIVHMPADPDAVRRQNLRSASDGDILQALLQAARNIRP